MSCAGVIVRISSFTRIRNQTFNVDSGSGGTDENAQNVALFKAVIKSLVENLPQQTLDDESADKSDGKE